MLTGSMNTVAQELRLPQRWDISGAIRPLYGTDTLTICILGDIMMHTAQISDAMQPDSTYRFRCFDIIKDKIASSDIAIANMEFTLAGKPYSGYPAFSAPESFATYLADCGFDIFLTANNHILDKGSRGAERTAEIYGSLEKSHGIRYTGMSMNEEDDTLRNPLIIRRKGYSIAILNMTYGTNLGKTAERPRINTIASVRKDMERAGRAFPGNAELLIAFPHWGTEYQLRHSEAQENTALWLADNGADLIVGAHPHVVQDFQYIGSSKVPTAYSLGNAVSNMSAPNTQIELMAHIRIIRDASGKATILQPEFTYLWCSRPGGYTDTYMVLPVREFIGSRESWTGKWEYDKMIGTYYDVMSETGIKDNIYNE